MNNLRAKCNVNNEAKIFRIEIAFATLKPAVKSETVESSILKIIGYDVRNRIRVKQGLILFHLVH